MKELYTGTSLERQASALPTTRVVRAVYEAHPGETALLVQQTKDTLGRFLDELQTLSVVGERDV